MDPLLRVYSYEHSSIRTVQNLSHVGLLSQSDPSQNLSESFLGSKIRPKILKFSVNNNYFSSNQRKSSIFCHSGFRSFGDKISSGTILSFPYDKTTNIVCFPYSRTKSNLSFPYEKTKFVSGCCEDNEKVFFSAEESTDERENVGEKNSVEGGEEFPLVEMMWDWDSSNPPSSPPDYEEEEEEDLLLSQYLSAIENNNTDNVKKRGVPKYTPCEEGYIPLFVSKLGFDRPVEEREETIKTLWAHSFGGRERAADVAGVPGGIVLLVTSLQSERTETVLATAGLLRNIGEGEEWRSAIVEAGGVEGAVGILERPGSTGEVKEQVAGLLWNLAKGEREEGKEVCKKMVQLEAIPLLVSMLSSFCDEERQVSAGCLSCIAKDKKNWELLVSCGSIPMLAKVIIDEEECSKETRKEAQKTLSFMAENPIYRLSMVEEDLISVPAMRATAFRSFKSILGEEISSEKTLTNKEKKIGSEKLMVMPKWEGVPRLVNILSLEEETGTLAAESMADFVTSEENRQVIRNSGAIPHLINLLKSDSERAIRASAHVLERLAISSKVRKSLNAQEAVETIVEIIRDKKLESTVSETVAGALLRLIEKDPEEEIVMEKQTIPGLVKLTAGERERERGDAQEEAEEILREVSSLKSDPRGKIIAGGGIPPLIEMISKGTLLERERGSKILTSIAIEEANAVALISSGVLSAIESVLELGDPLCADAESSLAATKIEDKLVEITEMEIWNAQSATAKLIVQLTSFPGIKEALLSSNLHSLLSTLLRSNAPLSVKGDVSNAILKLQGSPVAPMVTANDTIPRLVQHLGEASSIEDKEETVLKLQNLTLLGRPEYVGAIADAGGIFPLVSLLENGTPLARDAALTVLYNISLDDENFPTLLSAGAPAALERIVREGVVGIEKWKLALYMLRRLPV